MRLGLFGFGAAAHVAIQVARHEGADVYAVTRDARHRDLALRLGAVWAGATARDVPLALDAAIIFAPAGELVPAALSILDRGATLVLGGIHMSAIPSLDYSLLYQERVVRSVANNTRQDGNEFLKLAAEIPIRTETTVYPLFEANEALSDLKHGRVSGAAVLAVEGRT
jgi:propanol-preferring alcohol dehydrogenase